MADVALAGIPWWRRAWNRLARRQQPERIAPRRLYAATKSTSSQAPAKRQYSFDGQLDRMSSISFTAQSLATLFRAYQEADRGRPAQMIDIWERMITTDAHLRAVIDERREVVARKTWIVQAGGEDEADKEAAKILEDALRRIPNFSSTLEWQLTANPFGWGATEIGWERVDGVTVPTAFVDVPHRRFLFDDDTDEPLLVTSVNDTRGTSLLPGKWWYTRRSGRLVAATGLMRTAAIWANFKSMTMRDWLVYSDRFGIPYVTGEYEEDATDDDKSVLETAVANVGSDGWATFSDKCKILFHEVTGGSSSEGVGVHAQLVALCDAQISKLIAGATLLTETTGQASYAIGKVHQGRGHELKRGDAEWLAQSFEACIGAPFVQFNGLEARAPRLKIYLGLDVSVMEWMQIASLAANELGLELDEDQIRQMTYLRAPTGAALSGTKSGAAPVGDSKDEEDESTETPAE